MNAVLIGIVVYVVIQFAIGVWVSRQIKGEDDYILAGRKVGVLFGTFSVFATWFGAETVLGSGGSAYEDGLAGVQGEPFAYGVAILLMGLLLAGPLRRRGFTTFADLFRARFSRTVERVVVLLLVPGSILWAAAQIRGFGQIVSAASGVEVEAAIVAAFIVVVAYTMLGGFLADLYTDFVQGIAILIGLVAIFVVVILNTGSPMAQLAAVPTGRLLPMGTDGSLIGFIEQWAVPICGSLVALELISRLLATKNAGTAQTVSYLGGGAYLLFALVPVYLGLVGPALVPGLEEGEQVIPKLAETYLPTILFIMFTGALISAILSTVDSALVACSAMVSHNLVQPLSGAMSERAKVWLARGGVAVLGTIAFVIASSADDISDLVELASAFGTAGIFVVTMFGMFTRLGGPHTALAAILTGGFGWVAMGPMGLGFEAPYTMAVAAAAGVYLAGSLIERDPERAHERSRQIPNR